MSRRLRVLELSKGLDMGGSEVLLLQRMKVASRDRFDYQVGYLERRQSSLVPEFHEIGVQATLFPSDGPRDWRWVWQLRSEIIRREIDLVHVHSPLMAAGVRVAVRSLGRQRPRLITTLHSFGHHPLTKSLDCSTIWLDDHVFAVSESVAASLEGRIARGVEVLHYGVNVDETQRWLDQSAEISKLLRLENGPKVVTVANLRPEKGHETLLDAAARVHLKVPDAHFYVVGHGPLEPWVRRQIEIRDMSGYFHVLGAVPSAARVTCCADLFVLPSDREGRPVALMEAMVAGRCVVATAVGGVPDMIQDGVNGLLTPPGDPETLARSVVAALTNRGLRESLGREAQASASDMSMAHASERIEAVYDSLYGASFRAKATVASRGELRVDGQS